MEIIMLPSQLIQPFLRFRGSEDQPYRGNCPLRWGNRLLGAAWLRLKSDDAKLWLLLAKLRGEMKDLKGQKKALLAAQKLDSEITQIHSELSRD